MGLLYIIIMILCLLLLIFILIQNPKEGGFYQSYFQKNTKHILGVSQTSSVIEKITWILVILTTTFIIIYNLVIRSSY
ncbi:MAG: preprotein translocase subunit SecG [Candidatus Bostrichicola ureolyticus]|nr:MAG: preprotein translocase subunit SecG [Candidatus Bostrichicola ureolyticus]